MVQEITGREGTRQPKESAAQRRAREMREAHEGTYGALDVESLKNSIVRILNEIEDHEEEKKALGQSWSAVIKNKKEAIQYCRERLDVLNLPNQAQMALFND